MSRSSAVTRRALVLVLLAAGAVLAGLFLLGSQGTNAATQPTGTDSYAVLSRPATPADKENQVVRGIAQHDATLRADAARQLLSDDNGTVWLIPTTDGQLCLGEEPRQGGDAATYEQAHGLAPLLMGMTCRNAREASSGGLLLTVLGQHLGLVPDGVGSVSARSVAGDVQSVAVTNNVYRLSAGAFTVTFRDSDGLQQVDVPQLGRP